MTKEIDGTFSEDSSTESSTVSLAVFEQVKWERDIAIQQLEELGYGLGEKIRIDDDCISREHLIEEIESLKKSPWFRDGEKHKEGLMANMEHLQYIARKKAVEIVMDLCIRKEKTVKPREKTGEWQQDKDGTFLCSECGSGFKEQPTCMGKPMFIFCPLCGTRMKKGGNE